MTDKRNYKKGDLVSKTTYSKCFIKRAETVSSQILGSQIDSANAIDSKAQSYISLLAIIQVMIMWFVSVSYERVSNEWIKYFAVILLGYSAFNIVFFFRAILSKPFKTGIDIEGLFEMKDDSEDEVNSELMSNLYWSIVENKEKLSEKSQLLKNGEILLWINMGITLVFTIILLCII